MIDVTLLGTGGMMPLPNRWLASAMIRIGGRVILIDAGEGTQIAGRLHGYSYHDVDVILITHVHADHIGGLPGVLFSLALADRREPVLIAGPTGLLAVVRALMTIAGRLPYEVRLAELADGQHLPLGECTVSCIAGDHWVPCLGYRLDLPRAPRFVPEAAEALGLPRQLWGRLQQGENVVWKGEVIESAAVTGPPREGLAVGYVTDSRPTPAMPAFFRGVDLLICEGTFADPAQAQRASDRKHMLFREAATLAKESNAGALWLTHFSPALEQPEDWAAEATAVFSNTIVGYDGLQTTLRFPDR